MPRAASQGQWVWPVKFKPVSKPAASCSRTALLPSAKGGAPPRSVRLNKLQDMLCVALSETLRTSKKKVRLFSPIPPVCILELPPRSVVTLSALLSEASYIVPPFQRSYEWDPEKNALQLLKDLHSAFVQHRESYNLNTICVASGQELQPGTQYLNDGQQRFVTLVIILCALRDVFLLHDKDIKYAEALHNLVVRKPDALTGAPQRLCLKLRQNDHQFFEDHIAMMNAALEPHAVERGTTTLPDSECKTVSQGRMLNAAKKIFGFLSAREEFKDVKERARFASYVRDKTQFVRISAPSLQDSMRMFITINARGIPLSDTDKLKAHYMSMLDPARWEPYANAWEEIEELLGPKAFNDLFSIIMKLYEADPNTFSSVFEYFSAGDNCTEVDADDFLKSLLLPCSKAFAFFLVEPIDEQWSPKIRQLVNFMRLWNEKFSRHAEWLPLAIAFHSMLYHKRPGFAKFAAKHRSCGSSADSLTNFLVGLERSVVLLELAHARGKHRAVYFDNAIQILLKDGCEAFSFPPHNDETMSRAGQEIVGPIRSPLNLYLVMRLESLNNEQFSMTGKMMAKSTVEHILPKTVTKESAWVKKQLWSDPSFRDASLHRLGNLVVLSREQNSKASNYDFPKKKSAYFGIPDSPFIVTNQLRELEAFTPNEFSKRQSRCEKLLLALYGLSETSVLAAPCQELDPDETRAAPRLRESLTITIHNLKEARAIMEEREVHDVDEATEHLEAVLCQNGLRKEDTVADGNCQFDAIADQLNFHGLGVGDSPWTSHDVRSEICEHLAARRSQLQEFVVGNWQNYLTRMRSSKPPEWGDSLTLFVASQIWRQIIVLSSEPHHAVISFGVETSSRPLILGHIFERHYVSTRPLSQSQSAPPVTDGAVGEVLYDGIKLLAIGRYRWNGYPVGFETIREDKSLVGEANTIYHSRIEHDSTTNNIVFVVEPEDRPELVVKRESASAAWNYVLRRAKKNENIRCSGLRLFGFNSSMVEKKIDELPLRLQRAAPKPTHSPSGAKDSPNPASKRARNANSSPSQRIAETSRTRQRWPEKLSAWVRAYDGQDDTTKLRMRDKETLGLTTESVEDRRLIAGLRTLGDVRKVLEEQSQPRDE